MDVTTGLPDTSVMKVGKGGDIMIDCPYCDFARPVAACLATCEDNIVNWCPKIKTVSIEELDAVAPKALRGKSHLELEWQRRREFFSLPVLEARGHYEDAYDREVHGGGGLKSIEDLRLQQEVSEQDQAESGNMPDEVETNPDDVVEAEIEPGPYASGENTPEVEPADEPEDDQDDPVEEPEDDQKDSVGEPGEPEKDSTPGDAMEYAGIETATEAETESNETTEEDSSVAENKAHKYPCPLKSCDGGSDTFKGLKIHLGRKHKNFKGELPENLDTPKASKKTSKKTSKKSKPSKSTEDTGRLILVSGSACTIVNEENDFSQAISELKEVSESEEEGVKIYRLGPELRVRTIVEELE